MNVNYISDALKNLCGQPKLATQKLGPESARKLQVRLQELFAAQAVTDLINGRPHALKYDRAGEFALDLHKGKRLIFKPTQQPPPLRDDGSIDWAQVIDITVIGAEDYHD